VAFSGVSEDADHWTEGYTKEEWWERNSLEYPPFRTSERNFTESTKTDTGLPSFWCLVETCIACLFSNQNINKIAIMLRCRNGLSIILATVLH